MCRRPGLERREGGGKGGREGECKKKSIIHQGEGGRVGGGMLCLTVVRDEALNDLVGNILEVFKDWVADLARTQADDGNAWRWGEERRRVVGCERGRRGGREGGKEGRRRGGRAGT